MYVCVCIRDRGKEIDIKIIASYMIDRWCNKDIHRSLKSILYIYHYYYNYIILEGSIQVSFRFQDF